MKKVNIISKVFIMLLLLVPLVVSAKEEVKVYMFWGNGCPHCENAKKYFKELEEETPESFRLIEIEVWNSKNNSNIMYDVIKKLNENFEGVPLIVIGDETFSGFNSAMEPDIKDTILDQYEKEANIDIVGDVIEEKGYVVEDNGPASGNIIIMFLVIVIIGGAFYIFKKKK